MANPVTRLNELAQESKHLFPSYAFDIIVGGYRCVVRLACGAKEQGEGPNKKAAKYAAASAVLARLEAKTSPASPTKDARAPLPLSLAAVHQPLAAASTPPPGLKAASVVHYYLLDVENRPNDLPKLLRLLHTRSNDVKVYVYFSSKLPARDKVVSTCAGTTATLRETPSGYPNAADVLMMTDAMYLLAHNHDESYRRVIVVSGDSIFFAMADVLRDNTHFAHLSSIG